MVHTKSGMLHKDVSSMCIDWINEWKVIDSNYNKHFVILVQ